MEIIECDGCIEIELVLIGVEFVWEGLVFVVWLECFLFLLIDEIVWEMFDCIWW